MPRGTATLCSFYNAFRAISDRKLAIPQWFWLLEATNNGATIVAMVSAD